MTQADLFADRFEGPPGLRYEADFLSPDDEAELLGFIQQLPLEAARYKGYSAQRRVLSFGSRYDFDALQLQPAPPVPPALQPLRERVAAWAGWDVNAISDVLVAEYRPGTPLGWHRDVPEFEAVIGVSLAGSARMRFRRYPPTRPHKEDVFALELAPRSIYRLQGDARWGWQHSVAPTPGLRYSITLRTRR
jgi:alkylated DNA repair dioxygenase AlkB